MREESFREVFSSCCGASDPALCCLFDALHCQTEPAALLIDIQNGDLNHVADRNDLGWMLDKFIADLRNVYQTVLVDADIDEYAEINDIAHRSAEHHAGLEILQFQNIRAQNRRGQFVARVAAGFDKFLDDVLQRRHTDTASAAAFSAP